MQSSNHLQTVIHFDVYCTHCEKKLQHYYGFALQASNMMVDLNGCASSRNSMAVVHTMKIQTNIQEDGACDRLGMEKCDTFAQLESQDIIFSIHKIVLIKWLLCELAIILHFNRVCMFF